MKTTYESRVEGEARLSFTRFDLPGEGADFGVELPDGIRLRMKIKALPVTRPVATTTTEVAATDMRFLVSASLLDAANRVERDETGKPIVFQHHEIGVNHDYDGDGDIDLNDAIEAGISFYAPIVRHRVRQLRQARELAQRYGFAK